MASFYACDNRSRKELDGLKPIPGYCIFIDLVDSVALKKEGLGAWCDVMYNLIATAMSFLRDVKGEAANAECENPLLRPTGLPPLKVMGDCLMFYVPKRLMPRDTNALNIFCPLVNIIRVPKGTTNGMRPEVHIGVTSCQNAYELTFVEGTEGFHGKDIDLAARLLKEATSREVVMNDLFYLEAECAFRNLRSAKNVFGEEDAITQWENVQGPWAKSIRGFSEPVQIYKWRGPN